MRTTVGGLVVILSLCACAALSAQPATTQVADVRGQPVTAIRVEVDGVRSPDPSLPALLDVVVGRPLDPSQVRSSIEHLVHLQRFATVDLLAEPAPGGVAVIVQLTSAQRIEDVRVEGALKPFDTAILRAIRERIGSAALISETGDAVAAVQDVLGARGYLRPQIGTRLDPTSRREIVTLVVTGDPGTRWQVARLAITGIPAPEQAAAIRALGFTSGMPYDRDAMDEAVRRYTSRLRASGYYEAVVRTTPEPGQASTAIDLTVDVTRGPLVVLTFEGDSLPEAARRELVPVREEASVDEDLLEDSRNRITEWLQERGYWRARVSYSRRQTATGLEVVFTIARGRVYRVRSVLIGGAQALPEASLRQRVAIQPDDPFVPSVLAAGIASITQLYQNSGFPAVRVEQALVDVSAPSLSPDVPGDLEIRLRVTEGTRATVSRITFEGVQALDEAALRTALTLSPGQPFSSAAVVASREAVLRRYLDEGYRQAQIEARLDNGAATGAIGVTFVLVEGRQTIVDRILVVGNVRTSEDTIRRELRIVGGGNPTV